MKLWKTSFFCLSLKGEKDQCPKSEESGRFLLVDQLLVQLILQLIG